MKFGQIAAMSVVTLFAIVVMYTAMAKPSGSVGPDRVNETAPEVAAPVKVQVVRLETIDIVQRYSGMIEPRERLTLAFEIPGRIESLGRNADGQVFDEGVRVSKNDVLATLDQRELLAVKAEADALLLQAQQENDRAIKLSQKNPLAINKVELLNRATTLKIQQARAQLAAERLRYATLRAPVDGVISKRNMLAGESLSAHQPLFEILQVDQVSLVVGVPESRIRPLLENYRGLQLQREIGVRDIGGPLSARIRLVGAKRFGGKWSEVDGVVHTISESSDQSTGLFNVEIRIDNPDGSLRPGQIAVAKIIESQIHGFRFPSTAGIFQAGGGDFDTAELEEKKAELIALERTKNQRDDVDAKKAGSALNKQIADLERRIEQLDEKRIMGYFYVVSDNGSGLRAKQVSLKWGEYLEQGDDIILRQSFFSKNSKPPYRIVIDGQHRLAPNRLVRITQAEQPRTNETHRPAENVQVSESIAPTNGNGSPSTASLPSSN